MYSYIYVCMYVYIYSYSYIHICVNRYTHIYIICVRKKANALRTSVHTNKVANISMHKYV